MPILKKGVLMAGLMSAIFFAFAQQPNPNPQVKHVPIRPTPVVSGQQMYTTYCAVCHGTNGTGDGPAAPAMKTEPTDLTALSRKNGGAFPAERVEAVLKFGVKTPAHGTAEMPVWGDLMLTLNRTSPDSDVEVHQRVVNLTNYLKQIQR